MKTILCTNARDERNVLEWVIHHLHLGFDHILIVDHKSLEPIQSSALRVISDKLITIIRNDQDIVKETLMRNAHQFAINHQYDWMLYLDMDEFLILNEDEHVYSFLVKYDEYDQVGLNWLMFGSNYRNEHPGGKSVLSVYTRSDEYLDQHLKSFLHLTHFNTHVVQNFNPHVYVLTDMSKSVNIERSLFNTDHPCWFELKKTSLEVSAFIAHYIYQSYDIYFSRKVNLPRDDILGVFREVIHEDEFHQKHNEYLNEYVKLRYDTKNQQTIQYLLKSEG